MGATQRETSATGLARDHFPTFPPAVPIAGPALLISLTGVLPAKRLSTRSLGILATGNGRARCRRFLSRIARSPPEMVAVRAPTRANPSLCEATVDNHLLPGEKADRRDRVLRAEMRRIVRSAYPARLSAICSGEAICAPMVQGSRRPSLVVAARPRLPRRPPSPFPPCDRSSTSPSGRFRMLPTSLLPPQPRLVNPRPILSGPHAP